MLVLDSEGQQAWRQEEKQESEQERRLRLLAHDLETNSISVANDDRFDVSNVLNQMGTPMTAEQVQQRLKKCNSRLHFIRSPQFPELTGVYLMLDEWEVDPNSPTEYKKKLKHICGMESCVAPEFSVLHKTKRKIPNKERFDKKRFDRDIDWVEVDTFASETRGWRTVLVRLLHAGLINMKQINDNFPPPSRDSYKWWAFTH